MFRAFSSEVGTGSREENASKQIARAAALIPSKPERLLEWKDNVEHLLAVAWLLQIGDLAAPAIGDACLRDLG